MTHYLDLAGCDYFGLAPAEYLRDVGWLERGQPFATGAAAVSSAAPRSRQDYLRSILRSGGASLIKPPKETHEL